MTAAGCQRPECARHVAGGTHLVATRAGLIPMSSDDLDDAAELRGIFAEATSGGTTLLERRWHEHVDQGDDLQHLFCATCWPDHEAERVPALCGTLLPAAPEQPGEPDPALLCVVCAYVVRGDPCGHAAARWLR